jgi:hypothetical protein
MTFHYGFLEKLSLKKNLKACLKENISLKMSFYEGFFKKVSLKMSFHYCFSKKPYFFKELTNFVKICLFPSFYKSLPKNIISPKSSSLYQ